MRTPHIHTRTHTYTHTRAHTHAQAHTHAHAHTHRDHCTSTDRWVLRVVGETFITPFIVVRFRHIFVADVLTSMVRVDAVPRK